jgi:hypothetical protein
MLLRVIGNDTGNIEDIGTEYTRCLFRAVVNCPSKVVIKIVPDHVPFRTHPLLPFGGWVELSIP